MLNQKTQKRITADCGLDCEKFIRMSPIAERKIIEGITQKKLTVSKKRDYRKVGRGNPLVARRIIKNIEEVDKGLSEIKWDW